MFLLYIQGSTKPTVLSALSRLEVGPTSETAVLVEDKDAASSSASAKDDVSKTQMSYLAVVAVPLLFRLLIDVFGSLSFFFHGWAFWGIYINSFRPQINKTNLLG